MEIHDEAGTPARRARNRRRGGAGRLRRQVPVRGPGVFLPAIVALAATVIAGYRWAAYIITAVGVLPEIDEPPLTAMSWRDE